jgi:hypothetical protein
MPSGSASTRGSAHSGDETGKKSDIDSRTNQIRSRIEEITAD